MTAAAACCLLLAGRGGAGIPTRLAAAAATGGAGRQLSTGGAALFKRFSPASQRRSSRPGAFTSRGLAAGAVAAMNATEKYIFDLNGYIIVPQVFTKDEVASMNAAIDARESEFSERTGALRVGGDTPLAGNGKKGRQDLAGMLGWDMPGGNHFRRVLAHPKLLPYYEELCGKGYRMDHLPFILQQTKGAEGFVFHGGATDENGNWDQALAYGYHHGRMYNPLLAVSVQLSDAKEGDGGYVVIRGSHKSNFACPPEIREYRAFQEHAYQPPVKAGDVLIFSEALTHGTMPWTAEHTRRVALYRFAPAGVAYGRSYLPWNPDFLKDMAPAERAVMEPPYHLRLDRPAPAADGVASEIPVPRAAYKKAYDGKVFGPGTDYF